MKPKSSKRGASADPIREFYTRHPFPPPIDNLDRARDQYQDHNVHLAEHHLLWPNKEYRADLDILSIPEAERRNMDMRADFLKSADIAMLCLPDDASREAVAILQGHTGSVNALAVLPDGRIVSGSDDKTLRVWDMQTGRTLATVMFTDIVESTRRASEAGDTRWRELLEAHDAAVRRQRPSGWHRALRQRFRRISVHPARWMCTSRPRV